jgi:hypothetical protein
MGEKTIWVESIVGFMTKEPLVKISLDDQEIIQIPAEQAKEVARQINEAATFALADLFIVQLVTEKLGGTMDMAAQMLQEFRNLRESRGER